MKSENTKKIIMDVIVVTIGCVLTAFSIACILKPNGLVSGGLTGLSILTEGITGVPYTYTYYTLSLVVLLITRIFLGRREALSIIILSVAIPALLMVFQSLNYNFISNDLLLASIYFGVFCGFGAGLVLKRGYSQGGTDTIAKLLHKKLLPFISLSTLILIIDGVIIILSSFIYGKDVAIYAVISQVILMKSVDIAMFGLGPSKVKLEIISDRDKEILDYIVHTVQRGATIHEIKGGYSGQNRTMITTTCSPKQAAAIRSHVAFIDPNAFIEVTALMSVWGEGKGFERLGED
jgi:uncharacterized membrane-anchored protein YitT (DUF2179 family)